MKTFKDIIAWKRSYELTLNIYKCTSDFPRNEEFGLKSQMRRAAISIISNIAEGFKRNGKKDKIRFYNQAQASLEELKCQLMLSNDLGYMTGVIFKNVDDLSDETGRVLNGWIHVQS